MQPHPHPRQSGAARRRTLVITAALALVLAGTSIGAAANVDVPLWMRFIRWVSGSTSDTPVEVTMMGPHLQISVRQLPQADDAERAEAVRVAALRVLERYRDVKVAEREGYRPFNPTGQVGEEIHYTHFWRANAEKNRIDPDKPGSLLYRRTADGLKIVGVMYTAKPDARPEELDKRVPLSVGIWHRHVHFCGWPNGAPRSDYEGPAPRFGFFGSIADEASCTEAGGYWIPVAFGWMTHVYPNGKSRDDVWFGRQMIAAEAGLPAGYACTVAPEE